MALPTTPARSRLPALLLVVAVFATGATALAYEVAWSRGLVVVLGATATTAAVVLAVFVGSLGLGARWGGARAERHARPLAFYGVLELLAAAWALLALLVVEHVVGPLYLALAPPLPAALHLPLRVVLAALVVAPGATLLGATLPALVRHWVRTEGGTGRGTAWLYGANTLGAVLGALATGFFLIEAAGIPGTLALAAGAAALVGGGAFLVGWRLPARAIAEGPRAPADPRRLRAAVFAAALCGLVGLGVEIAGFRVLVFFVEGFTATFAAMLGVFVFGLGAGSLLVGPWVARSRRPERWLAVLLGLLAAALVVELVLVVPGLEPWMRAIKADVYRAVASPVAGLEQAALLGSLAVLLLPAFLMGATFALTVRHAELAGLAPGEAVGRIYLANSAGTLLAPFLVTFLFVPWMGPEGAWGEIALIAAGAAGAVVLFRRTPLLAGGVVLAAAALGALWLPSAEPGRALVEASHVLRGRTDRRALRVDSDPVTTASVVETRDGERILYTDDFAAAATGRHYRYMRMLGHLPVLLAKDPENALVIAFGTGTTAGAVAAHDEVKRLEVVEVSRAVLGLAPFFEKANRGVLSDPRTRVLHDDGRNVLLLHEPDLDVITLEPLMPYSPAGLPFYTKDFYELAKARLREGGVLCQWVPVHAMPAGLYAQLVKTFFEVFPDGSLWFFEQSSALIGRRGDAAPDAATVAQRRARVADDLAAAGLGTADAFAAAWIASGPVVSATAGPSAAWPRRTVTDMDPYPEFFPTPRAPLLTPYLSNTLGWMRSLVAPKDRPPIPFEGDAAHRVLVRGATARALEGRIADALAGRLAIRNARRAVTEAEARAELQAWRDAEAAYADAVDVLEGDRVLLWRRARAAGRLALAELRYVAPEARPAEERPTLLARLDGHLGAALALETPDVEASERLPVLLGRIRMELGLGRCDDAAHLLAAERDRFEGADRRRLEEIADALKAYAADGTRPEGKAMAGLFAGAVPCGASGVGRIAPAIQDLRDAVDAPWVSPRSDRRVRLAAGALLDAAREARLGEEAARRVEALRGNSVASRAILAALLEALEPARRPLDAMLASDDAAQVAAALREAGVRALLARHEKAVKRAAASDEPTVRVAVADAVAADGSDAALRMAVGLLEDPVERVRVAAGTAFVHRFPDEMASYDPYGDADQRHGVVAEIRKRL